MPLDAPSIQYARRAAETRFSRARALATEIDELLAAATPEELEAAGYVVRVAQGMTRSLIDQLDEIHRGPSSSRRIPVADLALPDSKRLRREQDTSVA